MTDARPSSDDYTGRMFMDRQKFIGTTLAATAARPGELTREGWLGENARLEVDLKGLKA